MVEMAEVGRSVENLEAKLVVVIEEDATDSVVVAVIVEVECLEVGVVVCLVAILEDRVLEEDLVDWEDLKVGVVKMVETVV